MVWFNNHSRKPQENTSVKCTASVGFLNLNPSANKTATPLQAYYAMHRKTFKTEILNAWRELKRSDGPESKVPWITFWNSWLRNRLDSQPADVKVEVENFRKTYSAAEDPDEPLDERNERFAS